MITYDLEANGLYEDATTIHCLVIKNDTGIHRFYDTLDIAIDQKDGDRDLQDIDSIIEEFSRGTPIICHNQLGYDVWMLRKFLGIDLIALFGIDNLVDTFVWSQALHPDRLLPQGCPTTIKMDNGKIKRIGPHGLDSYGYRVKRSKPKISDWIIFNNEILNRCEEDVLINEATYFYLLKERE